MNPWLRGLSYRLLPARARLALMKSYYVRKVPRATLDEPEADWVRSVVAEGDLALDIGANVGWYTVLLARLVGPSGSVHAFEPVPATAAILAHVVRRLDLRNVSVHASAMADFEGTAVMDVPRDEVGAENFYLAHLASGNGSSGGPQVPVTTIDALRAASPGRIAFIKCDVEGAELSVLRGARRVLSQDRPAVLCEVCDHSRKFGSSPEQVFAEFAAHGYRPFRVQAGELLSCPQPDPGLSNYVFLPDSHGTTCDIGPPRLGHP